MVVIHLETTMKRLLLVALMVGVSFSAHADNTTVREWDSPITVKQIIPGILAQLPQLE